MSIDDVRGTHQTQPCAGRGGFTLVELLAVIMIIALLAALVTPAVMRAMSSARAAAVQTEVELLSTALMNYKNEYGSFPPADMRGLWNGSSVNTGHAAYKHLQKIFPRISERTDGGQRSPYFWMAQMSPAQALVFWLDGFFDNPQFPLTNNGLPLSRTMPRAGTANANRNKMFDFDEKRLYAATTYWPLAGPFNPSPQQFSTRNDANSGGNIFARDYPVYFPNQANTGLPYVYFPNSSYSTPPVANVSNAVGPPSNDLYYTAISTVGGNSAVAPLFNSANCTMNPAMYSWAQLHMNPDTFQLIAAGADGTYGAQVSGFPQDIPAFSYNAFGVGPFASVQNKNSSLPHPGPEDNITNFVTGRLKEAAEKLSQ